MDSSPRHRCFHAWHTVRRQYTPANVSALHTLFRAHTLRSIQTIRRTQAGHGGPLKKILVANRGEIAIRVFRTAHELGMFSVAIYSHEDRMGAHRYKSDESYLVGKGMTPVAAYLAQDDIVRIALEHGVDMIHPGCVRIRFLC